MPTGTVSGEPVLLLARCCRGSGCQKIFYLCKSCNRGQCYCSSKCRALARRLQHRRASARYQQTPEGRLGHCDCQRAYRERLRSRSAPRSVTDPSSTVDDSRSSSRCDDASPTPHSHIQPPRRCHNPPPRHISPPGWRCLVCGRAGYLSEKPNSHEPDPAST